MANISKIAVGGTEYDIAGIGLIATIEETLTASKTYNVGDQFIYQGLLYKATQTIASGTAITIGSNCQLADVVADQLTSINSNLSALIKTKNVPITTDSNGTCIISRSDFVPDNKLILSINHVGGEFVEFTKIYASAQLVLFVTLKNYQGQPQASTSTTLTIIYVDQ